MNRGLNLPNILTLFRIIAIPVFVSNLIYRNYRIALFIFIFASITDVLDGFIARLAKQQTELGKILDPLADKFLLITSFVLFSMYGWIPAWLTIGIISRDLIVVIGWFLIYMIHHLTISPTVLGKSAIASQLILAAYILMRINFEGIFPDPDLLIGITAFITITSGLQYIYKGFNLFNE